MKVNRLQKHSFQNPFKSLSIIMYKHLNRQTNGVHLGSCEVPDLYAISFYCNTRSVTRKLLVQRDWPNLSSVFSTIPSCNSLWLGIWHYYSRLPYPWKGKGVLGSHHSYFTSFLSVNKMEVSRRKCVHRKLTFKFHEQTWTRWMTLRLHRFHWHTLCGKSNLHLFRLGSWL